MPAVSVIIPTYNCYSLLIGAINSVFKQSFRDYEIIVIDDGSTDNSQAIIEKKFSDKDNLKYIYQKNSGRSVARNKGISLATSKYVAFLDADDIFLPEKLLIQYNFMEQSRCPMSYTLANIVTYTNQQIYPIEYRQTYSFSGHLYPDILYIRGCIIMTPCVMIRKSTLEIVGGFDEKMHICEDLDLWRRVARYNEIIQIPHPLTEVRFRPDDLSTVNEKYCSRLFFIENAVADDPDLIPIKPPLLAEAYWSYGCSFYRHGARIKAWICFTNCALTDVVKFLRLSLSQCKQRINKIFRAKS